MARGRYGVAADHLGQHVKMRAGVDAAKAGCSWYPLLLVDGTSSMLRPGAPSPQVWSSLPWAPLTLPCGSAELPSSLFSLNKPVDDDRDAVEIVLRKGSAVPMAADEYAAWHETAYVFRSPANARRLLDAHERAASGETQMPSSIGRTRTPECAGSGTGVPVRAASNTATLLLIGAKHTYPIHSDRAAVPEAGGRQLRGSSPAR